MATLLSMRNISESFAGVPALPVLQYCEYQKEGEWLAHIAGR